MSPIYQATLVCALLPLLSLGLHAQTTAENQNGNTHYPFGRASVYARYGFSHLQADGPPVNIPDLYARFEPQIRDYYLPVHLLHEAEVQWQADPFVIIGASFLGFDQPLAGGGFDLELGHYSYSAKQYAEADNHMAQLHFQGSEWRWNFNFNYAVNYRQLTLALHSGFSSGFAKNYQVDLLIDNRKPLTAHQDFFRKTDFRFTAGADLHVHVTNSLFLMVSYDYFGVITYKKIPEVGLLQVVDLYGFRNHNLSFGLGYSWTIKG